LNQITSLSFDLNSILFVDGTPYDHQCPRFTVDVIDGVMPQWSHLWAIIAALENLVSIKVFLRDPGSPEWDDKQCLFLSESVILGPLWKVKSKMEVFELDVPWCFTDDRHPWPGKQIVRDAPFNLIRRGITDMSILFGR
jgi:hypothetical protein